MTGPGWADLARAVAALLALGQLLAILRVLLTWAVDGGPPGVGDRA
jgi:Zn-dependent M28 family amino/carboxypeptidase